MDLTHQDKAKYILHLLMVAAGLVGFGLAWWFFHALDNNIGHFFTSLWLGTASLVLFLSGLVLLIIDRVTHHHPVELERHYRRLLIQLIVIVTLMTILLLLMARYRLLVAV